MFTSVHRADRCCVSRRQAYLLDNLHSDRGYQLSTQRKISRFPSQATRLLQRVGQPRCLVLGGGLLLVLTDGAGVAEEDVGVGEI